MEGPSGQPVKSPKKKAKMARLETIGAPPPPNIPDVADVSLEEQSCSVPSLKYQTMVQVQDGHQWSCNFHEEIYGSCSKMLCKERGNILQLIMQKKIPFHIWPSLMKKRKGNDQRNVTLQKPIIKDKAIPKENVVEQGKSEVVQPKRIKQDQDFRLTVMSKGHEKAEEISRQEFIQEVPAKSLAILEGSVEENVEPTILTRTEEVIEVTPELKPSLSENVDCSTVHYTEDKIKSIGMDERERISENMETAELQAKSVSITTEPQTSELIETEETERKEGCPVIRREMEETLQDRLSAQEPFVLEDENESTGCCSALESVEFVSKSSKLLLDKAEKERTCLSLTENTNCVTPPMNKSDAAIEVSTEECAQLNTSISSLPGLVNTGGNSEKLTDESLERLTEVPEPMVNLSFIKNDYYEKGSDIVVVHVYVKGLCKETTKVLFRESDFTMIFKTSDPNFLRLNPGCGSDTLFRWQVKLRNSINPEQCIYKFPGMLVNICLKKRHSQRWGGLEAPTIQGAVGGAKVAVPAGPTALETVQPGSSQHPMPSKEEPRAAEKESSRLEESSLEGVAARGVSEHVSVKQDHHVTVPKPTCKVTPMTHNSEHAEDEEEKKVCMPGFTGLVNLGNTCFMNSVIQSLSNTRELRDYFHDRSFESEINYNNPLGTGGRLAIGFAVLLRALWKGTHHAFQPSKLKAIVASKASQFTGYAQHDAQEFMAFLLDGLHEDMNRVQNKPYIETVDSDGRPDEVVAEEAWRQHKMRNDSFIVDLFQGQYKSKLVCPTCAKVSITFDPFLYLPVPLPQKQKLLTVFYFAKEPHRKPTKFLVSVSKENATAADIIESISRSTRVNPENLCLTEVFKNRFHRFFTNSYPLDTVSPTDLLFCFEVLSKELVKEKVAVLHVQQRTQVPSSPVIKCAACQKMQPSDEEKLKRCTRCYRVGYCNQICQKNHWPDHKTQCRPENIGYPFVISIPESRLTFFRLTQLLEEYSRYSVNVFQPPLQPGRATPEQSPTRTDFQLDSPVKRICPTSAEVGEEDKDSQLIHLDFPKSSRSMSCCEKDSILSEDSGFLEEGTEIKTESESEKETSYEKLIKPEAAVPGYQQPSEPLSTRMQQFSILVIDPTSREHKLEDRGDSPLELAEGCSLAMVWKNNERQKEYVLVQSKELEYVEDPGSANEAARIGHFTLEQCLNLFTKPEVLAPEEAWYCPKCKQHREASKQLMLWRLPNALIIQLKRFSFRSFIWRDKINEMVEFPVRNLDLSKFCIGQNDDSKPPIYDLYAVINHYGGMIGGHYTAYARLPNDKNSQRSDVGWRLFDDSTVTTVEESQVVTRYAYVLFYRRRNSPVERPTRVHTTAHHTESATSAEASATQAASHIPFGSDLDPDVPPQLMPETVSDLYAHSEDCSTPSYSNMEEVD
ncbi:ubiquitin carboxyl-terminal hydrolase 19 [Protopterus annectens]|uniref:ubiquitin carboxyl-terminal hydrolase 19 n=1 Tax=Protopterus annectens TaxID=7888 RepID=UPI001CF95DD9|nr:ubiquitin carboxyl-terminal hydrolase 19 [Protopterus annectens]